MELTGNVEGLIKLLGGGEGSTVTIEPLISSGLQIAKVTIDGEDLYLYIPTPQDVSIDTVLSSGTKIAEITINNEVVEIYAPSPTNVSVTPAINSGTKIADISVNGVNKELYAPEGGGHEYSTTEQRIGTWIDGRAVYEKTYIANNINIPLHGIYQLDSNITSNDIDIIMRECCTYKIQGYNNSYTNSIGGANVDLAVGNSFIYIENYSEFTITDLLITIRYVKISS